MDIKQSLFIIDNLYKNYDFENKKFNERKCLTYIDEYEQKLDGSKRATSLVSITALMNHYISSIEYNWMNKIRLKYNFLEGEPIHFTTLRKISQTVEYGNKTSYGWNDEFITYKFNSLYDYEKNDFKNNVKEKTKKDFLMGYKIWTLFRKENINGIGILDIDKLKEFYEDIFHVIKESNFHILCTTIFHDLKSKHRLMLKGSNDIKSAYTIAFQEHLDLLCFYLKHGFYSQSEIVSMGKLYNHNFTTKLRWDGDNGFNPKQDYRSLFNKVVSLGTTHYSSNIVRDCLDEIRFINKNEIGYHTDSRNQCLISHIGCDIADFIAYFVGKYSTKDAIINMYKNDGLTLEEAETKFFNSTTFKIGDRLFDPYNEVLKEKILINDINTSIQHINECNYNIW